MRSSFIYRFTPCVIVLVGNSIKPTHVGEGGGMRITFVFFASLFLSFAAGIILGVTPLSPSIQGKFILLVPLGLFVLGLSCLVLGYRFHSENEDRDNDG